MTLDADYFDALYARSADPWGFRDRWYEQRKYALTLAALPRPRYRRALEAGCSIGVLTRLLAVRCDYLLATDVAGAAVAEASKRTRDLASVEVRRCRLPQEWPGGSHDLVILSEIGYYFNRADLQTLLDRSCASLEPGGTLLAVHWRHPVADYPLGGDEVHDVLDQERRLTATVRHVEDDFLLTVYGRTPPPVRSVAAETGLR